MTFCASFVSLWTSLDALRKQLLVMLGSNKQTWINLALPFSFSAQDHLWDNLPATGINQGKNKTNLVTCCHAYSISCFLNVHAQPNINQFECLSASIRFLRVLWLCKTVFPPSLLLKAFGAGTEAPQLLQAVPGCSVGSVRPH